MADGGPYHGSRQHGCDWSLWSNTYLSTGRDRRAGMLDGLLSSDGSTIIPESIGSGVSSGCVGLLTRDMMHLYSRTPIETKVVVLSAKARRARSGRNPPV
jgi:hypothetical protein